MIGLASTLVAGAVFALAAGAPPEPSGVKGPPVVPHPVGTLKVTLVALPEVVDGHVVLQLLSPAPGSATLRLHLGSSKGPTVAAAHHRFGIGGVTLRPALRAIGKRRMAHRQRLTAVFEVHPDTGSGALPTRRRTQLLAP